MIFDGPDERALFYREELPGGYPRKRLGDN